MPGARFFSHIKSEKPFLSLWWDGGYFQENQRLYSTFATSLWMWSSQRASKSRIWALRQMAKWDWSQVEETSRPRSRQGRAGQGMALPSPPSAFTSGNPLDHFKPVHHRREGGAIVAEGPWEQVPEGTGKKREDSYWLLNLSWLSNFYNHFFVNQWGIKFAIQLTDVDKKVKIKAYLSMTWKDQLWGVRI